ncbi:chlorophyllase-2-like [Prosopis cineraria]|uniref:chlorophyllase-2-like n=1 Tax=Prosopis cineraria TaxID=364024 RepID=UPI00240F587F|nr:chlorophyllase-2-like [Prosopis cineraria]
MHPSHSSAPILADVFETGNFTTQLQRVDSAVNFSPPKPLLIATPLEPGNFPLFLFLHGYLLYNSFYSQLILHIASHGFIVVAPQLYTVAGPDISNEIGSTAAITNWLAEGLSKFLPPNVKPNCSKLALGGHSRGGKTAFAVGLKKLNTTTNLKFSALIGIDPVDGMDRGKQTPPPVLTYKPHSFDFDMASLVIGSGLGELKKNPLFPPCAPKGVNHEDFFDECPKPSWHFVARNYGHLDMLDDETKGIIGKGSYCLCKNGESRKPMRRFVGGAIVAFLKAYLLADDRDLIAIRDRPQNVPLDLKTIECYV